MTTPPVPAVFVACPQRGDQRAHALSTAAAVLPCHRDRTGRPDVRVFEPLMAASSLLTFNFNQLWATALNARATDGATHFAMLHDDVVPEPGWLDTLLGELVRLDADVVSCVIPFKDDSGLTSTGVETGDRWNPRRLTMREVYQLPETFDDENAGGRLLLNTGCWVARLDRKWCERVCFEQMDSIIRTADGTFAARTASEDWNFTRAIRVSALFHDEPIPRLFATRKVRLFHDQQRYHNAGPWGRLATDPQHQSVARPTEAGAA